MTTWRDDASPEAQDDLDALLHTALPFATGQLERHGEFFPYGVVLTGDGEAHMVGAGPELGERPASAAVLAALIESLRSDRDSLRAVALVSDVALADSDGVRVQLEHLEGQAITVVLPYTKRRFGRGIHFGELSGSSGESFVWTT